MSFYISVTEDQISLGWDGLNPPGLNERVLQPLMLEAYKNNRVMFILDRLKDPQDLLESYPLLKVRARYRKTTRTFIMSLCTENLRRIFLACPGVYVKSGDKHVTALYDQQEAFKKDLARAALIKSLPDDKLPTYQYKVPPLAPYQHRGVAYLTNVKAGVMFADCGCLSGDTEIRYSRGGASRVTTLAKLFKRENAPRPNASRDLVTKVRSLKGARIGLHEIVRVVQSGVKETWLLSLANYHALKATPDHEIRTARGFVALKDLTAKDYVMTDDLGGKPSYVAVARKPEYVDYEMTYDIVCADPHRNFVANGMVVHNCGKTYMTIAATEQQIKKGLLPRGKTLVCVKLATIKHGWLFDTAKFSDLKAVAVWTGSSYKRKEKLLALLNEDADFYVINHEGVRVLEKELTEKGFKKIVIDESTILKGYRGPHNKNCGAFGKALSRVAAQADYRVIMSGTPAPNDADDLWGQFAFVDPSGFLLGRNFRDFKASFMKEVTLGDPRNPANRKVSFMTVKGREEVSSIIIPPAFRVKLRDHILDMPAKHVMSRSLPMSPELLKHYEEMEERLETEISGEVISASVMLTKLQKLSQITGGFMIDKDGTPRPVKDNPKIDMMDTLLNEEIAKEEKVVIFAQYRYEIELLAERYKHYGVATVYGGNTGSKNLDSIDRFLSDPAVRLIILHPLSAAHGITLTNACYMIFYSTGYSNEQDYQAVKRIERASQKREMRVYYLLCEDSIDEVKYETIVAKQTGQLQIIDKEGLDTDVELLWKQLKGALARKRGARSKKKSRKVAV